MVKPDFFLLGKKFCAMEKELTKRLIKWRFKRGGLSPPDEEILDRGSEQIMSEVHSIMKRSGKRVFDELRLAKKEFLKAYRDEDKKGTEKEEDQP